MNTRRRAWARVSAVAAKSLIIPVPILTLTIGGFSTIFFVTKCSESRATLAARIVTVAEINAIARSALLGAFDPPETRNIIQAIATTPDLRCIQVADEPAGMRLEVRELPEDELELRFTDDGRRVPADTLPRIFEPFFTTRRGSGGSGLGLHIVVNLVIRTLGGRIAVDSKPGVGTVFTMRLPYNPAARALPQPVQAVGKREVRRA